MFSTIFFLINFLITLTIQNDVFAVLGNYGVGAQRIHYGRNLSAISRNTDNAILISTATTTTSFQTLSGFHKANVKAIGFNPPGTKIATGGQDFTISILDISSSTRDCHFIQIHGIIQQLLWLSDDVRVVGISDSGYAYVFNTTSCLKLFERQFYGQRLMSVLQRAPANQLWIANYGQTIFRLNYDLTDAASSFNVGTSRLVSLFTLPSNIGYSGVCTQKAFYLYNGLTLVHTRNYPASPTIRCRVTDYITTYIGVTGVFVPGYFLAATSGYNQLFQIWKLQLSAPFTWLIRVQPDDNRHGSKPHTVQLNFYRFDTIQALSSSQRSKYIYNIFSDLTTTLCDTGTISSKRIYGNWQCTLCVDIYSNDACYDCSSDVNCDVCYDNHYKSGNDCFRCPQGCYACTSSTSCTICHPQLALNSNNCIACNISHCLDCQISSSTYICSACQNGYYVINNKGCQPCNKQMQNCIQCTSQTTCTRCQTSYKLFSTNNGCQPCSQYMKGCQDCVTTTFCDLCNKTTMPYYHYVSSTARYCQASCHYRCLTCSFYYDNCVTCDSNRTSATLNATLGTQTCNCNSGYFQDPNNSYKCINCSDFVTQCSVCQNTTYCNTCNTGFYFNPTATGYRSCLTCNYSCATCSSSGNYYDCATCSASDNRVLNSSRCPCSSLAFYQVALALACVSCSASITNCLTCYNGTFCLTCVNGYYINVVSAGNANCMPCGIRCLTCDNGPNNCTSCKSSQNRKFNLATFLCDCYTGYLQIGSNDICQKCSDYLTSCATCTNTTVCITCMNNNYLELNTSSGKIECNLCQAPCLTCSVWSRTCATCSATALRVLNPVTKNCDCQTGYAESGGYCLNCNSTFPKCIDCNISHCKGCQPGYALSNTQLQCLNCSQVLIGCKDCLNGVCILCNPSGNFILSISRCICNDGYYYDQKNETCLPYAMGASIKRYFTLKTQISTDLFNKNTLIINTTFNVDKLYFPYGALNSFKLYINGVLLNTSQYSIKLPNNYSLVINYTSSQSIPRAEIVLQFLQNHIYDRAEYQLKKSLLKQTFYKNIYADNSNSSLAIDIQKISSVIKNSMNYAVRYIATVFLLLGSMDVIILFTSMYHVFPLYLMMQLSIPGQLQQVLKSMILIHQDSLYYVPYSDQLFPQNDYSVSLYINQLGLGNSFFHSKHIDLIFFAFSFALYGVIGYILLKCFQKGKNFKLWKGKFEQRRYSTVIIAALALMVPFVAVCNFDYYGRVSDPGFNHTLSITIPMASSYFILGGAITIAAFFFGFIFFHINAISLWRLKQDVKTQDCYMGMSKIDTKCDHYVLSQLFYWIFVPLGVFYLNGLAFTIIATILVLWNLSFYRFWILFPNKVVYFCRLFSQIGVLVYNVVFLVYHVSQAYSPIQVRLLVILGYLALTCIVLNLGLNLILAITFIIQTIIRLYKTNNSILQQLAQQNTKYKKSMAKIKDLKGRVTNILSSKKIPGQYDSLNDYQNRRGTAEDRDAYGLDIYGKNIFTRNRKLLMTKDQN